MPLLAPPRAPLYVDLMYYFMQFPVYEYYLQILKIYHTLVSFLLSLPIYLS